MSDTTTMMAVRFHEYGTPDVLKYESVNRPVAGDGEVLVRIDAASVNPIDGKLRSGDMRQMMSLELPFIPGNDFAGTVEALGANVHGLTVGQAVYGLGDPTKGGAYAEYAAISSATVAHKPTTLDFTQAASVPVVALTAWQSIFDTGGLQSGQRILVHGGAGGVGMFAVQFAKWKGVYVIATASAENLDFVRDLGADEVIDYQATRFEDVATDVDVVLDTQGGETQSRSYKTMKPGGILVATTAPPDTSEAAKYGVRAASVHVQATSEQLQQIAALLDSGTVRTFVTKTFPLSDARAAQELVAQGHGHGKIVLIVG